MYLMYPAETVIPFMAETGTVDGLGGDVNTIFVAAQPRPYY
jgi:hypothetical protein